MVENEIATHSDNFEAFMDEDLVDEIPILKFNGKEGRYHFGIDGETLEIGTRLILNADEIYKGFIQFHEGEQPTKHLANMKTGSPIPRTSLGDNDPDLWPTPSFGNEKQDPWIKTVEALFADPKSGQNYKFSVLTAKTHHMAIDKLIRDYMKKRAQSNGEYPEVELGKGEVEIKQNKVPVPVFNITGWVDCDAVIFNVPVAALTDQSADDVPFEDGLPSDSLDDLYPGNLNKQSGRF